VVLRARLQGGKALLRRGWRVTHLVGVAEDRRRDRAADVDVDALIIALAVWRGEPGHRSVYTALDETLGLDRIECRLLGLCTGDRRHTNQRGRSREDVSVFHLKPSP
jgi:hypothetical protein